MVLKSDRETALAIGARGELDGRGELNSENPNTGRARNRSGDYWGICKVLKGNIDRDHFVSRRPKYGGKQE